MRKPTALLAVFAIVLCLFTLLPTTASARVISLDTRELRSERTEFGLSRRQGRVEEEVSQTSTRPRPTTPATADDEEEEEALKTETKKTETKTQRKEEDTKTNETVRHTATADVLAAENESQTTPEPRELDALPFQPKLNPALGIAGVLLILAGLPYAFIGIKNKRLQISLSVLLLSSLAVIVLILYVSNPPVSAGTQGAYLVACVLTGLVLAALSVLFHEMTETLGCLLGGFTLAMWVLVLKPDGLITNGTGKSIFLGLAAVGFYAASFWTRIRGGVMIASISFSGATAVVLGIDCFSRAGLKEFWIFIWALNPKSFPEGTASYPHTRGIKVEIAAIVIVTIFAVMSQVRIWNVVKTHRERKEEMKELERREVEERDLGVGREVEERTRLEREAWEAQFGAPKKGKEKVEGEKEKGLDVDIVDLEKGGDSGWASRRTSQQSAVSVKFEETEEMRHERERQVEAERLQNFEVTLESGESSGSSRRESLAPVQDLDHHQDLNSPPPSRPISEEIDPAMIPLPPSKADLLAEERRKADMIPPTEVPTFTPTPPVNRVSASTFETLDESDWEDHEAATLAAQEASSARRLARERKERDEQEREKMKKLEEVVEGLVYYADEDRASSVDADVDELEVVGAEDSESEGETGEESGIEGTSEETQITDVSSGEEEKEDGNVGDKIMTLRELKEGIARMPKAYRTNQWALHLNEADQPDLEELELNDEAEGTTEKAAPVMVESLLQTYLPAQRPVSSLSQRPLSSLSQRPSQPSTSKRSSSILQPRPVPTTAPTRTFSTPLPHRISTTPPLAIPTITTSSPSSPLPFQQSTLLAIRESQMRARPSYIFSSAPPHPSPYNPTLPPTPLLDSGYTSPTASQLAVGPPTGLAPTTTASSTTNEDDLPLSTHLSALQKRAQRDALLAQWRQSVRQDEGIQLQKARVEKVLTGGREEVSMEGRVGVALKMRTLLGGDKGEKSKAGDQKVAAERERELREMGRMPGPELMERHREAMMRLQGSVKAR